MMKISRTTAKNKKKVIPFSLFFKEKSEYYKRSHKLKNIYNFSHPVFMQRPSKQMSEFNKLHPKGLSRMNNLISKSM